MAQEPFIEPPNSIRNSFESYRGIFFVNIFRSILDKLIYNDEYENIDKIDEVKPFNPGKKYQFLDKIFLRIS